MTKKPNLAAKTPSLIANGWIDPTNPEQFPITFEEVARIVGCSIEAINFFEPWANGLCVHFFHRRNQLISYRQFSAWEEAGEQAINRCTSGEELQAFADAVNIEKQRFQHIYQHQETLLQRWRKAWALKKSQVQVEEERRQKEQERQQQAHDWKESCENIAFYCPTQVSLVRLWRDIRLQYDAFRNLPELIQTVEEMFKRRSQQLAAS